MSDNVKDLLKRMQDEAIWIRLEKDDISIAILLEEAVEMIRGMQDAIDAVGVKR